MAGASDILKVAVPLVVGGSLARSYMGGGNNTQAISPQSTAVIPQQNSSFYETQQEIHPYIKNHLDFMNRVTQSLADWINQTKPNIYKVNAVMNAVAPLIEQSKYLADTAVKTAQARAAERIHMFDTLSGGDNQTPGVANATNSAMRLKQAYNIVYGNNDMDANAFNLAKNLGLTQQPNTQQALPTTQQNNNNTDYWKDLVDWNLYNGSASQW
jgi:Tfp pilus assembly protein PilV